MPKDFRGCECPYHGGPCPGPDRCAPAVMLANRANEEKGKVEGIDKLDEPVCPIVNQLEVIGNSMSLLCVAFLGEPEPAPEPEREKTDVEIKRDALLKLGFKQEEIGG